MTDLDAAAYLTELKDYAVRGLLRTPQNDGPDTIWSCALSRAIRALEAGAIPDGQVAVYSRNPNGSFSAKLVPQGKEN